MTILIVTALLVTSLTGVLIGMLHDDSMVGSTWVLISSITAFLIICMGYGPICTEIAVRTEYEILEPQNVFKTDYLTICTYETNTVKSTDQFMHVVDTNRLQITKSTEYNAYGTPLKNVPNPTYIITIKEDE